MNPDTGKQARASAGCSSSSIVLSTSLVLANRWMAPPRVQGEITSSGERGESTWSGPFWASSSQTKMTVERQNGEFCSGRLALPPRAPRETRPALARAPLRSRFPGMTVVVGLSGGIGTGKSSVARCFADAGGVVIDADAIVPELPAAGTPVLAGDAE